MLFNIFFAISRSTNKLPEQIFIFRYTRCFRCICMPVCCNPKRVYALLLCVLVLYWTSAALPRIQLRNRNSRYPCSGSITHPSDHRKGLAPRLSQPSRLWLPAQLAPQPTLRREATRAAWRAAWRAAFRAA